jgi:predicted nuclease of restriction endonuclease-like (RecB) superfamily
MEKTKVPVQKSANSELELTIPSSDLEKSDFFNKVAFLIEHARAHVGRTADLSLCVTYYLIGSMIVEREQNGKTRALYGKGLIPELSEYLNHRFEKGFSETNLKNARKFYLVYSPSIRQTISAKFERVERDSIRQIISAESNESTAFWKTAASMFKLSWSHYQILMRIKDEQARRFYEIEAIEQQWTYDQLNRQYHSSLYERLALSRDKAEVMRLANEGHTLEKPKDVLKDPLILEFLGMEEKAAYTENDLESAIISKLQHFLLELGKGFLFEARQKRFSFDEEHFFVDLVFYNRLLQCYVLIDLKTEKLTHQDLGQMQMYVNYFDRYVKRDFEKPTVGILLCRKKKDHIVQLTLPKDANIYAAEYSLYLPDKNLLEKKLAEWTAEFETVNSAE